MFKKDILIIDFETSSLDTSKCTPLQLGAVLVNKENLEIVQKYSRFIKPCTNDWNAESAKIHGLNRHFLEKAGSDVFDVFDDFSSTFDLQNVLLASWHNFDMQILDRFIAINKNYKRLELWSYTIPYLFANNINLNKFHGHGLDDLLKHFNLKRNNNKHDALEDSILEANIFKEVTNFYRRHQI